MEQCPFQAKTVVLLFPANDGYVVLALSPNLQVFRLDELHDGIAVLQLATHTLLRNEFFQRLCELRSIHINHRQFEIVTEISTALRSAGVVQLATQVLEVLPGGEPGPIGAVIVGREPLLGFEVHVGDDEMQLRAAVLPVLGPDGGDPVAVHAGNQKIALEAVDQLKAGLRATFEPRRIVLGEAQNPRGVPLGEPQRVDQLRGCLGIAA
jgi:hypothetical protein